VLDLLHPCRHFRLASAVDDHGPFRPEAAGGTDAVHGGVAAADNRHVPPLDDRRGGKRVAAGLHQVDPGEEFVGRVDPFQVLPRDIQHDRQTGAVGDEDGVEIGAQLLQGEGLADDDVAVDAHPELHQTLNLRIDDFLGEAEFGDAVTQNAAGIVQRLEHRDPVAGPGQFPGRGQAGRTGTDNRHRPAACLRQGCGRQLRPIGHGPVGHEPLQVADGHRFTLDAAHASGFALGLLGADPAADRRQGVVTLENAGRQRQVFRCQGVQHLGNRDPHRTAVHAGAVLALDAAFRLLHRFSEAQAGVDLLEIATAHGCIKFGHVYPGDCQALLHGQIVSHWQPPA